MAKFMVQGTGSSVGKSVLTAAFCRIFKQDGLKPAPYKSQNMSLNSYITLDGKEMGRAQVLQAYAAGLQPEAWMNPILLKPTTDRKCQVIVNGRVFGNSDAKHYHNLKTEFRDMLKEDFIKRENEFDVIVMEGAGSPAEINLRENDIVNMGMAELVDAPVILVGDIDKGGVFAQIVGTLILLTPEERKRVKGYIINKFRGDVELLKPGIEMLKEYTDVPCLGVVPYFHLNLEDEDGSMSYFNKEIKAPIDIAVIKLPHISNFTDFDALAIEEDVSVRYVTSADEIQHPDVLIIPGSKNTIGDLNVLRQYGFDEKILRLGEKTIVFGICGGYQMLGKTLKDPSGVEADPGVVIEGLGLLDIHTVFEEEKVTTRVNCEINPDSSEILKTLSINIDKNPDIYGYEIHMGVSSYGNHARPLFNLRKFGSDEVSYDGAVNSSGTVFGTYVHGIFDGTSFREGFINMLRTRKGITAKKSAVYESYRDKELDKLADLVRNSVDIKKIYEIIGK